MNFEDMGWAGHTGLVVAMALMVLALVCIGWAVYVWMYRKGRDQYFVRKDLKSAFAGFGLCVLVAVVLVPYVGTSNVSYHEDIEKDKAAEVAKNEAVKQEEENEVARNAQLAKAQVDLEKKGYTVVAIEYESNGGGRIWVEIQGVYPGCTYQFFAVENPRGKFVLNLDSGSPFKTNPEMVFPENDGNAYTPKCPPGLDLPEGGK